MNRQEAEELLRVVSAYGTLLTEQVGRLFPGKTDVIMHLLGRLCRQQRLHTDAHKQYISSDPALPVDPNRIKAFWVLLDLLPAVEYHIPGQFPAAITFLSKAQMYDIICIGPGQETSLCFILRQQKDSAKRILLLETMQQAQAIEDLPDVWCLCTVESDQIHYFKRNEQDGRI